MWMRYEFGDSKTLCLDQENCQRSMSHSKAKSYWKMVSFRLTWINQRSLYKPNRVKLMLAPHSFTLLNSLKPPEAND